MINILKKWRNGFLLSVKSVNNHKVFYDTMSNHGGHLNYGKKRKEIGASRSNVNSK